MCIRDRDKGTPFGWQSWGVLEKKNSFDADVEIADYYHEVLKPNGFVNSQGMQIIGIDSWDNLSTDERIKLCKEGGENGQTVGLYFTPFSWWWGWSDKMGSTQYTACLLYTSRRLAYGHGDFCPCQYAGQADA